MIKKEFKDILKPVGFRVLSGVMIISLFFTAFVIFGERDVPYLTNFLKMFNMLFWVVILWVSYNLGINMFKKEQTDHAMEYLLSSPLTKTELILKKVIPRLFVLVFLLFIYFFIYNSHLLFNIQVAHYFGFFQIMFFIIAMFFCAAFLSIYDWGNFKALVWVLISLPGYNLSIILDHFLKKNIIEGNNITISLALMNLSLLMILIILGIGFIFVFKYSDIRPQRMLKNKFSLIAIIPLITIVLISFFIGIIKS